VKLIFFKNFFYLFIFFALTNTEAFAAATRLHPAVSSLNQFYEQNADDFKQVKGLCAVVSTQVDCTRQATDEEREILYKPLIDTVWRLSGASDTSLGDSVLSQDCVKRTNLYKQRKEELESFFNELNYRVSAAHSAYEGNKEDKNREVFFHHQLTVFAVCRSALTAYRVLNLKRLTETNALGVFLRLPDSPFRSIEPQNLKESEPFKKALEAVSGLNGEILQVKAYAAKRKPDEKMNLVLCVSNMEENVEQDRFDKSWIFLDYKNHDAVHGRCLTVDFNDLRQLQKLSVGLAGIFDSIVWDIDCFSHFQGQGLPALQCFKSMLKKQGKFIFMPASSEGYVIRGLLKLKELKDFDNIDTFCKQIMRQPEVIRQRRETYNGVASTEVPSVLRYPTFGAGFGLTPGTKKLLKEEPLRGVFDQFILDYSLGEVGEDAQRIAFEQYIQNKILKEDTIPMANPILWAAFGKENVRLCEGVPYPINYKRIRGEPTGKGPTGVFIECTRSDAE
jgi:hypothetical protein